jgi:hypothetical protein
MGLYSFSRLPAKSLSGIEILVLLATKKLALGGQNTYSVSLCGK